jgi:hypothetical protein
MIDHPQLTANLLAKLKAALPLPAIVTPYLAETFRKQSPQAFISKTCEVVWLMHAGDEGGIVCKLAMEGDDEAGDAFFTSITHLDFDRRHPLARDIAAYQKRRIRKLRRQNG